jgi:hypothetical protein
LPPKNVHPLSTFAAQKTATQPAKRTLFPKKQQKSRNKKLLSLRLVAKG